jgi:hypothetical protein
VSLENIPERCRDWRPGADGIVLDLVHPSLFPVVYGRSKVLKEGLVGLKDCVTRCGEGVTLPMFEKLEKLEESEESYYYEPPLYSRRHQWMPCDIVFQADKAK